MKVLKISILLVLIVLSRTEISLAQGTDEIKEKQSCVLATGYDNISELKQELLTKAKRAAVEELFGEFLTSYTQIDDFVLSTDQIRTSTAGYVRVEGNPQYANHDTNFGEVCVLIRAYATTQDRQKFDPISLKYDACYTNNELTTQELPQFAKDKAVIEAILNYDRRLELVPEQELVRFMRNKDFTHSEFDQRTGAYCAVVVGEILPLEITAIIEANELASATPTPTPTPTAISSITSTSEFQVIETPTKLPAVTPTPTLVFSSHEGSLIAGTLEGDIRLSMDQSPYVVQGKWTIADTATVLIDPGVVVKFQDNAHIDIYGTLIARGTSDHRIVFTSFKDDDSGGDTNGDGIATIASAGDWAEIIFRENSNDSDSIIEYAEIKFAGKLNGSAVGAVSLISASPSIQNNTITNNHWYAISADPDSYPKISGNILTENAGNGIEIRKGDLKTSGSWLNTDIVYAITGVIEIQEGTLLRIGSDTKIKFLPDVFIDVFGALRVEGEEGKEPIFTSIKDDNVMGDTNGDGVSSAPQSGDWTMIRFRDSSNDVVSLIEHAVIRYAGNHGGSRYGAIHLESASPSILNNQIEFNSWYAVSGDLHSFPEISGNTIANNTGNGFEIRKGTMSISGDWLNRDIAYTLTGIVQVEESATLNVGPGVMVKFADDVYLDVFGTFKVQADEEEKAIFTSIRDDEVGGDTNGDGLSSSPLPGDWSMIRFRENSNDLASVIEYAEIKYAGEHGRSKFGAIHFEQASPTIKYNLISNSFWYAMSADNGSFPNLGGNELTENVGNGLEIRPGTTAFSGNWTSTDTTYVITSKFVVGNGTTLNLDPGVVVKFHNGGYIDVNGTFRATGSGETPVVFTSIADDEYGGDTNNDTDATVPQKGDWLMIRFNDESNDPQNLLDNTILRYAGTPSSTRYGAIHLLSASPTISNSRIEESAFVAIWGDANSEPLLQNNSFTNNAEGDVLLKE